MVWPFKDEPNPDAAAGDLKPGDLKPGEKTPAELIAESVTAALKPFQDSMNTRFQELEGKMPKPAEPRPAEPGQPTSVLDNEDAAFGERLTPLLMRQFEMEARINRDSVLNEFRTKGYGGIIESYGAEITKTLDQTALANINGTPLRGDPEYIRNVVSMIIGRHAVEGKVRFDGKAKSFFIESATGGSETEGGGEQDGLTDAQRRVALKMGVPADQLKAVRDKLQYIS